jgi:O-antigen/teichoic acid export membrane protein
VYKRQIFNTIRTLSRSINQINAVVVSSILPELQYELGSGNLLKARKLFHLGLFSIIIIAIIGVIILYLGGPMFYEIWTRRAINPPSMVWNILLIGVLFNAVWWLSSDVLIAANKPYEFTIAGVIAAVLSVTISYFLSSALGLTGAAIGSLFLDISLFAYVLPRSCVIIKQPLKLIFVDVYLYFKEFRAKYLNLKWL